MILPYPDSKLLPNRSSGKHWTAVHKAKDAAKATGYAIGLQNKPEIVKGSLIPLEIHFYPPDNRKRDLDGALSSMKSTLDGVAQAWGVDDSCFRPITIDMKDKIEGGKVVITVKRTQ